MKRNNKFERHKELRRLYKEYDDLWKASINAGTWIDVEPYQRGWVRTFVLRDDAHNRNDARELQRVLDLINTTQYCRRVDFTQYSYKTRKYEPMEQRVKYLKREEYSQLTEKLKSYFHHQVWTQTEVVFGRKYKRVIEGYVFRFPYYFVLEVSPNIITQQWIPDAEIERRRSELHNKLYKTGIYYNEMSKAMNWSGYMKDRYYVNEKRKLHNEGLDEFVDEE